MSHRIDVQALGQVVLDDLRYLKTTWNQEEINDDFLRRDSTILRRLLVNGDLQRYRRAIGLRGEIRVMAPDLNYQLSGANRKDIIIASAGGTRHRGASSVGLLTMRVPLPPPVPGAHEDREWRMSSYLDAPCIVANGVSIRRRDVINYVANKLGGAHYDEARKKKDSAYAVLDAIKGQIELIEKEIIFFELLAIGQAIAASPDVAKMLL